MTREDIKNRMMAYISDEYDKSEGSFFYDIINTLAIELEAAYEEQNQILDQGFVETAVGEYLDRKVAQQGLERKAPQKATTTVTIYGTEGIEIEEGALVASDSVNFIVKEGETIDSTGEVNVEVECEKVGKIGNVPVGAIKYFPVTIATGLVVTNPTAVTNGYDGETDEELRERYYDKVRTPATSGNKNHYKNWAKEVTGVGDARVFPLWNDNGTVKVVIIDSNKKGADPQLVTEVYSHIEENRPIGATVTVESAQEKAIDIAITLSIDSNNYSIERVQNNISNGIDEYLKKIAFVEDYVSYGKIGSIILNSDGVLDYSNLKLDSDISNIPIASDEVAILGVITIDQ